MAMNPREDGERGIFGYDIASLGTEVRLRYNDGYKREKTMAIRVTQAGVALTVGIILVTGLIIGGFFIVKNNAETARREEAIKIAEQNLEEQSGNDVALNEGDSDTNSNESTSSDDAAKNDDAAKESTDSSNAGSNAQSSAPVSELPQTGPADQFASLVVMALITFSVVSYIGSRQTTHGKLFSK